MAGADTIDVRIRLIDEASKQMRDVQKNTKGLTKEFGELKKVVGAIGLGVLAKQAGKFMVESTELAARVETLGVVTKTLGANAGISATEITRLERAIQKQGITTQASRQALAKMMQAQLDVADSADLARLAQDAAVIAGTNSSEAFSRLVDVIATGNVRMARTMGLQVDFNAGYEAMAEQLDKTTDELTAQEKAQSRANAVMEQGAQIAGAYEDAMGTVGKQLESTARYWEEFRRAFGEGFIDPMGEGVTAGQRFLKVETQKMDIQNMLREAEARGLITLHEKFELTRQSVQGDTERIEVMGILVDMLDEVSAAMDRTAEVTNTEITLASKLGVAMGELTVLERDVAEAKSYTDLAARILTDGLTIENIAIWEQVAALEAQKAAQDALAGGLKTLAPMLLMGNQAPDPYGGIDPYAPIGSGGGGGVYYGGNFYSNASWSGDQLMRNGQVILNRAGGGPLTGANLVGEQGPELIIGNQVIPARQTRQMMNAGIRPGRRFAEGGFLPRKAPTTTTLATYEYDTTPSLLDMYSKGILPSVYGASDGITSIGMGGKLGGDIGSTAAIESSASAAAESVGFVMSQNITSNNSIENAKTLGVQSEQLDVLRSLPTVDDMYQIMRDVIGQLVA